MASGDLAGSRAQWQGRRGTFRVLVWLLAEAVAQAAAAPATEDLRLHLQPGRRSEVVPGTPFPARPPEGAAAGQDFLPPC